MHIIINRNIPSPTEYYPHIPDWLVSITLKASAVDQSDRFDRCEDFLGAIEQQEDQSLHFRDSKHVLGVFKKENRSRKSLWIAGVSTVVILGFIATGVIGSRQDISANNTPGNILETSSALINLPSGMEFVEIPAGSFVMGSPLDEQGHVSFEEPQHPVQISSFEMMTTEVTQGMWREVMGQTIEDMEFSTGSNNGFIGAGENYPMYYVSWNDCQEFIQELNKIDSSYIYRLPSEAEWEYAARAGTDTRFYWGEDPTKDYEQTEEIHNYAHYASTSAFYRGEHALIRVGELRPNDWGLYDMSGNIAEWCQDLWHENYVGVPSDGAAWEISDTSSEYSSCHVIRGGHYYSSTSECRAADRSKASADCRAVRIGFRLVRSTH